MTGSQNIAAAGSGTVQQATDLQWKIMLPNVVQSKSSWNAFALQANKISAPIEE
jgi:hypothetical protein